MKIYFDNNLGAGDRANILPVLQYLISSGHEVFTSCVNNLYNNTSIKEGNPSDKYDVVIPVKFVENANIPATVLKEAVHSLTGIEIPDNIPIQSLEYDDLEVLQIERAKKHPYVNLFPYTTIRQKSLAPLIARNIVEYLQSKGLKVMTSRPWYDGNTYPWDFVFAGCEFHPQHDYFSRQWIMEIASAQLNICIDGGPVNVSLVSGAKTLGLLTLADESLCRLYPKEQWRVAQSTLSCSPCFKSADYGLKEVRECLSPKMPCGFHFDRDDVINKIEELLK